MSLGSRQRRLATFMGVMALAVVLLGVIATGGRAEEEEEENKMIWKVTPALGLTFQLNEVLSIKIDNNDPTKTIKVGTEALSGVFGLYTFVKSCTTEEIKPGGSCITEVECLKVGGGGLYSVVIENEGATNIPLKCD